MKLDFVTGKLTAYSILAVFLVGTAGCSSLSSALGMQKTSPDEFAVVTKAPLIIPPDFSLKPPKPGAPRPNVMDPSKTASAELFKTAGYEVSDAEPSQGEQALVEVAGADDTDGSIRAIVEEDYTVNSRPKKTLVGRLKFWDREEKTAPSSSVAGSAGKEAELANQRYAERVDRKTFAERLFFWRKDTDSEDEEPDEQDVEAEELAKQAGE